GQGSRGGESASQRGGQRQGPVGGPLRGRGPVGLEGGLGAADADVGELARVELPAAGRVVLPGDDDVGGVVVEVDLVLGDDGDDLGEGGGGVVEAGQAIAEAAAVRVDGAEVLALDHVGGVKPRGAAQGRVQRQR